MAAPPLRNRGAICRVYTITFTTIAFTTIAFTTIYHKDAHPGRAKSPRRGQPRARRGRGGAPRDTPHSPATRFQPASRSQRHGHFFQNRPRSGLGATFQKVIFRMGHIFPRSFQCKPNGLCLEKDQPSGILHGALRAGVNFFWRGFISRRLRRKRSPRLDTSVLAARSFIATRNRFNFFPENTHWP